MLELTRVESALVDLSEALDADGYALALEVGAPDRLRVRIVAGPQACEDCLIPKSMMQSMIGNALQSAGLGVTSFELEYPVEGHGAAAR